MRTPDAVEATAQGCELTQVALRGPEGVALEADETVPPEGEGDAVREDRLELALD